LYLHITENPIDPHRQKDDHHPVSRARSLGPNDSVMGVIVDVMIVEVVLCAMDVIKRDVGGVEGRSYFQ
jgi:hypothetical protein